MTIAENLRRVHEQIVAAGKTVQLVAVSKTQSCDAIREAVAAGQRSFGENYVQELVQKAGELADLHLDWHFIGHLQRNKINSVLPIVSTIHSIDSVKLAEAIGKRATRAVNGFVEINIGGEASKTGFPPNQLQEMLRACCHFANLQLNGLMCIPPVTDDVATQKKYFKALAALQGRANVECWYRQPLTDLSMGMSHDFQAAIACGATVVRIGTAIFGER